MGGVRLMTVEQIARSIGEMLQEYGAQLVAALIGVFAIWFRDSIFRFAKLTFGAITKLHRAQRAIASDKPWTVSEARDRADLVESKIPIICFANLKGGVGKTTLAANIAAYYATEVTREAKNRPCRVLAIDLDFQGSLSSMLLGAEEFPPAHQPSLASQLISGELDGIRLCQSPTSNATDRIRVVPAFYDLAKTETRLFLQWTIRDYAKDLRYVLRDVLLHDKVQEYFDVVVIDAPPRLSTACIQALCASTHLLIPTKLDRLSGDAVGAFMEQIEDLRELWPKLAIVGVLGTMVSKYMEDGVEPTPDEVVAEEVVKIAVETVYRQRQQFPPKDFLFPRTTYICDSAYVGRHAGDGVAYLKLRYAAEEQAREMLQRLGAEIQARVQ